ncbi:hypothetical protein [Streptomyces sp. NPDC059788]|uniref:hypothetical protein n=1 Tax=Streptomyces sp. NPDC059788 TaxID=3346948 RepID=UPI00365592FE
MTEPVEGVQCPACHQPMEPPLTERSNWWCYGCGRNGVLGETPEDIEDRERGKHRALRLLEEALARRGVDWTEHRKDRGVMPPGIQTRETPCPECQQTGGQGTMYKTVEVDEDGNETGESQWVCGTCGHVE